MCYRMALGGGARDSVGADVGHAASAHVTRDTHVVTNIFRTECEKMYEHTPISFRKILAPFQTKQIRAFRLSILTYLMADDT